VGGVLSTKEKLEVFVINLKRSTERKEYMAALCEKNSLFPEFITAVDGRRLDVEELLGEVCLNNMVAGGIGRELCKAEIGCALSHKEIYQKLIDQNIEQALVLEDDVEFDERLIHVLGSINTFPSNWEIVLLGHHGGESRFNNTKGSLWDRKIILNNYKLVRPSELAYGAYGYLINKRGASKLLAELELMAKPIDHYTGDSYYINLYAVSPPVIGIHEDLSDNFHSMEERKELQAERDFLENPASFSWYKRMAVNFGLYHFLSSSFIIVSGILNQVKPLKKYK